MKWKANHWCGWMILSLVLFHVSTLGGQEQQEWPPTSLTSKLAECTISALSLQITPMTLTEAKAEAKRIWGDGAVLYDHWFASRRYTVKEVGFLTPFGVTVISGRSTTGSWRRGFNPR